MHTIDLLGLLKASWLRNNLHANQYSVKKSRNFKSPVALCISKSLWFRKIAKSKHAAHAGVPFNSGPVCTVCFTLRGNLEALELSCCQRWIQAPPAVYGCTDTWRAVVLNHVMCYSGTQVQRWPHHVLCDLRYTRIVKRTVHAQPFIRTLLRRPCCFACEERCFSTECAEQWSGVKHVWCKALLL